MTGVDEAVLLDHSARERRQPNRRLDIQVLRAVAVTVVVAYHAQLPLPGGFVGVDVFFVISGFVITAMLQRELAMTGRISFRSFYFRRFKRLTPALAFVIAVTVVASALIQSPLGSQRVTAATAFGALAFVANGVIYRASGGYFEPDAASNPLLHTWSLSVEEQFYFVFPLLLALAWRHRRRSSVAPLAAVGFVTLLSAALALSRVHEPGIVFNFYSPFLRAWEFGAGAALALLPPRLLSGAKRLMVVAFFGWVALLASLFVITSETRFPGPMTLLPAAASLGLIASGPLWFPSRPGRVLQVLVYLGDISYSWYLWHWPVIVLTSLTLHSEQAGAMAAGLSLIPAILSYHLLEARFRALRVNTRKHALAAILAVITPAAAVTTGLYIGQQQAWWSPSVRAVVSTHVGWDDCMSFATTEFGPRANPSYSDCTLRRGAESRNLYLVGDSNAAQFAEGLIGAGQSLDATVNERTAAGCPFIDVFRQRGAEFDGPDSLCREYYESTLHWLEKASPGVVVIAEVEGYWFEDWTSIGTSLNSLSSDQQSRATALTSGLISTIHDLQAVGHEVLLVAPMPHIAYVTGQSTPEDCSVIDIVSQTCTAEVSQALLDERLRTARSSIRQASAATGAREIDFTDRYCRRGECSITNQEGDLLMQDKLHVTVAESEDLRSSFVAAIKPMLGRGG